MDLITTHINADFDALGSLVAAKKLYPNSRLLLPGSQEQAVREFLSLAKDTIIVESERECKLDDINRLVIVDARQRSRIGLAAELIKKGVEVHIYDHHTGIKGDIVADKDVSEEVGATVTILADIIKRKRLDLSYLEATIMLLGIYEETGSLTYRTTTRLDVDMASFLLSKGASLAIVSRYLNRELTEAELSLFARLINATERFLIKGISVSMVEIKSEDYVGELGMLIHKLMEIENIPVLFVFVNDILRRRIGIIARSRIPTLDVNGVLSHFDGGGHPGAASAKVEKAGDIHKIRERLIKILESSIKIKVHAKDIMSKNVVAVSPDKKINETKKMISNAGLSALPVLDKDRITGVITLTSINKAIRRGFGHSRVKGYMSSPAVTVKPNTPLYAVQKIIMEEDVGVIPVVENNRLIGVINRTDVLKNVHEDLLAGPKKIKKKIIENVSKKMYHCFSRNIMNLLKRIGRTANSRDFSAFVVGGLVRDLLLGSRNLDLDIVIEGNAIAVGEVLARDLGGTLVIHKRFGTCTVITKGRLKIDLATARKETYEKPAALPTVEFSSLRNDLIRRDFTINAMAVSLNEGSFGQLIDFFGGEGDLAAGRIKVLHDKSFIDDPTRIFRAVRFEQRFGFRIDNFTEELILGAVNKKMIDRVEPQRLRDELVLILKEREPLKALRKMEELNEFAFLHPRLKLTRRIARLCIRIGEVCDWYERDLSHRRPIERWIIYLMALFDDLSYADVLHVSNRFVFRKGDRIRMLSYKACVTRVVKTLTRRGRVAPSEIYSLLEELSYETIITVMAKADSKLVNSRIKDFLTKYNGTRIAIKGGDLKALGLKPSPRFKKILHLVLYKKIDGLLRTKRDELEYVKELINPSAMLRVDTERSRSIKRQ